LDHGKTFTIKSPGASSKNKYIQKAAWNGKEWSKTWFTHEMLLEGGALTLEMGEQPSGWGKKPADCPESVITEQAIVPAPFVARGERVFQKSQEIGLGCLDPEAVIYYTLDGSEPTIQSARYRSPVSIDKSVKIRFFARHKNGQSAVMEAEFSKMQAGVKIIRYNTKYDNQYTARGDNGLVDQLRGGADFRSGGWQGYSGVNLDVVIDLGEVKTVHQISAGFLQDENSWIFFPTSLQVEVSDDGRQFTPVGETLNTISPAEKGALQQDLTMSLTGIRTRYIHVKGVSPGKCPAGHKGAGNPCWIFADEILVE
jgi:hypothetical protein